MCGIMISPDELATMISTIVEQPVDVDTDLEFVMDSLAIIEILSTFHLDWSKFDRKTWRNCKTLAEVINHDGP